MCRQDSPLEFHPPLSASQLADLRLAASKMSGPKRRAFAAEMTLKYGGGNPLRAETLFGWGRHTVALGLAERRTGIMCLGAQAACSGRHRWEDEHPEAAEDRRRLAAAPAHHDPTFRTPLADTRRTAKAALEALRPQGYPEDPLPAPSTLAEVLNRRGCRLRKVVQANPPQKMAETDAIFATLEKKTTKRGQRTTAPACAAMVQPRCLAARCREAV